MQKLNIAIIVPSLINRGPVIVVKDIVEQIADKADRVVIFYLDNIPAELSFNCEVQKLSLARASKQLKGFNIIHAHMLRPNILVALLALKHAKKIATLHNYIYNDVANTHNKIIAKATEGIWTSCLKRYNKIVCLTQHMKQYYQSLGLKESKLNVIYNGRPEYTQDKIEAPNPVDIQRLNDFKSKFFVLGVSAMLSPRKGIDQLIKALTQIPEVGLLIVGDGPEKANLVALAENLKVAGQCIFLGYKQKAYRYFKYFDAFGMPSHSEGFPLAFIEATSFSLPVLVSDLPIFREIVHEGEAIFAELNNNESMINSIMQLKANKAVLSEKSRLAFKKRFDAVIMGDNYLAIYNDVLNNKK